MDQLVTYKQNIGATSIEFPKYANLAAATTPLTDKEDAVSSALSDSQIILSPLEYGAVVTKTLKVSAATGGKADLACAQVVAENMRYTLNKLAILAAEASGNEVIGGTAATEAAITTSDLMTAALISKMYNRLSKAGVAKLIGGQYVAVLHPDQIFDIKNESGSGNWLEVNKYSNAMQILSGEVGQIGGFRIIEDASISVNDGAGSGTVDSYHGLFLGYNALGKAVSLDPRLVMGPAGDKLQRFMNVGWYGILKYGIVDTDACWLATTASSIGANT